MITSKQWWDKVKNDDGLLIDWLRAQYHGEKTAAIRIKSEFSKFEMDVAQTALIEKIAKEEELHAEWVGKLLLDRGIEPEVLVKNERYWNVAMVDMDTIEDVAAIAHHAEHMRLERIRAISEDSETPSDIKVVFSKILPMEINHEKWFGALSSEGHIASHKNNHEEGMVVLGLVI